jgi:hypothetical protein
MYVEASINRASNKNSNPISIVQLHSLKELKEEDQASGIANRVKNAVKNEIDDVKARLDKMKENNKDIQLKQDAIKTEIKAN